MNYQAWLCYKNKYDEDVVILFEEPELWRYDRIVPIAFTPLKDWREQ